MRTRVVTAFAAVYLIWGSTYLAIRLAVEALPPFFMAGTRFIISGSILYLAMRFRGAEKPSMNHWGSAVVIGGLMLLGCNGIVSWSEQFIPSGLTSIIVATVPLWIALLDWLMVRNKPRRSVVIGLIIGFGGVALLVGNVAPSVQSSSLMSIGPMLVFATLLWAIGSLYSRSAKLPSSSLLGVSMEMICGGFLLLAASFIAGEWGRVRLNQMSVPSTLSWIYLVAFGSLIGYTSYMWLLKNVNPERVSTYAYINPVVALFLGYAFAKETLSLEDIVATLIILASVVLVASFDAIRKLLNKHQTRADPIC